MKKDTHSFAERKDLYGIYLIGTSTRSYTSLIAVVAGLERAEEIVAFLEESNTRSGYYNYGLLKL